jgi:GTPase SAR1 family protein
LLLIFAMTLKLNEIGSQWAPEVRRYGQKIPFILVGTKLDLRLNKDNNSRLKRLKNQKPVSMEEGAAMAKRIGAVSYFETSSDIKVSFLTAFLPSEYI